MSVNPTAAAPTTWSNVAKNLASPQKIAARVAIAAAGLIAAKYYEVNPLLVCAAMPLISLPSVCLLAGAGVLLEADSFVGQSMIPGKAAVIAQHAINAALSFGFLSAGLFDTRNYGLFEWYAKK